MQVPRHLLWSKDNLDLQDRWQRRWFIRQVLLYGRAEDVSALNWDEIRRLESFTEFEVSWRGESVRVQLAYDSP